MLMMGQYSIFYQIVRSRRHTNNSQCHHRSDSDHHSEHKSSNACPQMFLRGISYDSLIPACRKKCMEMSNCHFKPAKALKMIFDDITKKSKHSAFIFTSLIEIKTKA